MMDSTEKTTAPEITGDRLLNERQAGELLSLQPATLRTWRSLGRGPSYVVVGGRSVRYRLSTLLDWMDALPVIQVCA